MNKIFLLNNKLRVPIKTVLIGSTYFLISMLLHFYGRVDYLKLLSQEIGNVSSMIFGVSSGILSLVGLVAIFVSINIQHRIQKCRELYWQMIDLPNQYLDPFVVSKELRRLLWHYSKIISMEEKFVVNVIWVARVAILVILGLWSSFVGLVEGSIWNRSLMWLSLLCAIVILLIFHRTLGKFNHINEIGELPKMEDLLDANKNTGVRSLLLLISDFQFQYARDFNMWSFLTVPLRNYTIKIEEMTAVYWDKEAGKFSSKLVHHWRFSEHREWKNFNYSDEAHLKHIKDWIRTGLSASNPLRFGVEQGDTPSVSETMKITLPPNTIKIHMDLVIKGEGDFSLNLSYILFGNDLMVKPARAKYFAQGDEVNFQREPSDEEKDMLEYLGKMGKDRGDSHLKTEQIYELKTRKTYNKRFKHRLRVRSRYIK
ncbi:MULTISPECIES: hypothetical protein [Priestia]|uniref:hypothetical protein n=1 Tax=Priestia TaxID=2800373 RepID=UPI000BF0DC29|nr:hypothetical protein [Priestia aryabhattai]PEI55969.1 hypothetical protein CN635_16755 [Priestia aryabhattai]